MLDAVGLAPGRKFAGGFPVGFSGVRVPDVRREEFEDAPGRAGVGREEGGEGKTVVSGHRNQIVARCQLSFRYSPLSASFRSSIIAAGVIIRVDL